MAAEAFALEENLLFKLTVPRFAPAAAGADDLGGLHGDLPEVEAEQAQPVLRLKDHGSRGVASSALGEGSEGEGGVAEGEEKEKGDGSPGGSFVNGNHSEIFG